MTSIEWLIEQFNLQAYTPHIEQAKEMHKKEVLLFAQEYDEYV